MEDMVAAIPVDSQKIALEDKSENTTQNAKRPAPSAGGCRIEGYVRVKKVTSYKSGNQWKNCLDIVCDHKGTVIVKEPFFLLPDVRIPWDAWHSLNCAKNCIKFGNNNAAVIALVVTVTIFLFSQYSGHFDLWIEPRGKHSCFYLGVKF